MNWFLMKRKEGKSRRLDSMKRKISFQIYSCRTDRFCKKHLKLGTIKSDQPLLPTDPQTLLFQISQNGDHQFFIPELCTFQGNGTPFHSSSIEASTIHQKNSLKWLASPALRTFSMQNLRRLLLQIGRQSYCGNLV